jgi:microcystin-dependent protein
MKDVMRLRYFDNEFLDAADFGVEQEYHRSMRYWHTRHFHTWGLSYKGLEVNLAEGQETGEETKVCISPGIALDNLGREIVLTGTRILDFDQPQYKGGKSYYITIYWYEQQGLPRQDNEHKRWVEVPELGTTEEFPKHPDMNLVLAHISLREDKTIKSIDGSMRRYAAHEVGNKTVTSVKIVEADGTSGQDINRGDGIKTGHIQARAVTAVKLVEDVEKSLVPVGCVSAFAMETPPDGWLECNGQAISRTDYERLFNTIGITFGAGDGDSTFNVPDLRGRFVRGWAHGSDNDPHRDVRVASASGGTSGDQVGSFQDDALQGHIHNFQGHYTNTGTVNQNHYHRVGGAYSTSHNGHHHPWPGNYGFTVGTAGYSYRSTSYISHNHLHYYTPHGTITDPTTGRTSSETRPKNIYLMYCIKY